MKILMDTTYLLPSIGIAIKEIAKDAVLKLTAKGYGLFISEITLFELSAKGAKYVQDNLLLPERINLGIRSILHDDGIGKISGYDSKILLTAFSLRSLMTDFIDCLILSTALNRCEALLTEDQLIQDLKGNQKYLELQSAINPKFHIFSIKEIQNL